MDEGQQTSAFSRWPSASNHAVLLLVYSLRNTGSVSTYVRFWSQARLLYVLSAGCDYKL